MIRNNDSKNNIDFKQKRQRILDSIDVVAEAKRLGLRLLSDQPGQSGWITCHAVGRDDATPSAGININNPEYERGYYRDHGSDSQGLSFFDLAVELGEHSDFESAFRHYAERVEPGGLHAERPLQHHQTQPKQNGNHQSKPASKKRSGSPGELIAEYVYRDTDGNEIFKACRFLQPDGNKTFRQMSLCDDGWKHSMQGVELVPYHLPAILERSEERIFICEGEKDVERLISLGILATCNPMGAGKWKPEFSKWFAGREVVVIADNDQAGIDHAEDVAAKLHAVTESIRVVHLPALPEKGDVSDFLDNGNSIVDLYDAVDEIEQWKPEETADKTNDDEPGHCIEPALPFKPFPSHLLPDVARQVVEVGAKSIGCDPCFIALPLLVVLGAVIGNTRRLILKSGWIVPPIIWGAIIGESGNQKSPAFKLVMKPARHREMKSLAEFEQRKSDYERERAFFDKDMAEWKRIKKTDDPPPEEPILIGPQRLIVTDITIEALTQRLQANPRGLCLCMDELAGWIGGFDKYSNGKGDSAHWLSTSNAEGIIVDRKSGNETTFVPRAAVNVIGGIQPGRFRQVIGTEHRESGLLARFLLCYPPHKTKRWTDEGIPEEVEQNLSDLIEYLHQLDFQSDDEGKQTPICIGMTGKAKDIWVDYYNQHAIEQSNLQGDLRAAWSKLEEYPARLALVLHYINRVDPFTEPDDSTPIDELMMQNAIDLTNWFKHETRRVYAMLGESKEEHESRQLIEWIQSKGGTITARELQQGRREIKTSADAEKLLASLVTNGYGKWETVFSPKGGPPKRVFHLSTRLQSTQPP